MTSLRLSNAGGAVIAGEAPCHLFDVRTVGERYPRRGWAYAASAGCHVIAIILVVALARALIHTPPRPMPRRQDRMVAHAFVFGGFHDGNRPRAVRKTTRPADLPAVVAGDATPLPPTRGELRDAHVNSLVSEKPPQPAFDPPIPIVANEPRMAARYGEPREAGFSSAAPAVRGLPAGEIRPGGLGEGNARVSADQSIVQASAGFDGTGEADAATPPCIQQPLPIPNYPAEARTRRLQGVVVLEVMLDSLGRAHVRHVVSDPIGFGIEEAATNAAEKLKFTPARQGGRSVDAIVQVRVTFTLTGSVETAVTGGA